ncbi:penicillin acylase family protein [Salinisphaera hydrothermalis]|uniref:Acyl-homoserine lactone acylase PvdQ n=1 Tax=Salinisphaera hydrothermalis (strain C41B8) TaxID=1304275 RepID=A0A084II25_SALHC|nr:penicillin acylase family protein [Salinisphaera hydrothermalis]KEZ76359.1 acyl-homoserine lactone acylase PvdQ precursor [Salinisphaera hydrothermalis C41B8]
MGTLSRAARPASLLLISLTLAAGLNACSDHNHNNVSSGSSASPISSPDGKLQATIRTTTDGVPHIVASNLESGAFGEGYVQARDNVCIIADSILRATGRRAEFYGPGPNSINIITDFSYRALGLLDKAQQRFASLSPESQAMLRGFAAGYNKYVSDTAPGDLPGKCANQPWVQAITPQQLYAYYQLIALYASGDQFATGVTFSAAPPGVDPSPTPATPTVARNRISMPDFARIARTGTPKSLGLSSNYTDRGMASNGWGIGGDMTENGRGALLANPHFPYTGNRRLYQSQLTIPGYYNVNGAALIGFVVPLIGFNQDVAWTHTVSTANHFTVYQLQLAAGDNMTYMKDGQPQSITSKTFQIQVANGTPTPTTLQKTFYYSEYGPMIAANLVNSALPAWGDSLGGQPVAFTYRDANADTASQTVDQWLGMGRAHNLAEFKKPFQACGSVLWVNTMYADTSGQAFYIDGTSVPNLSSAALTAYAQRIANNPLAAGLARAGVPLLDGSTSRDDWVTGNCNGRVPYNGMPKLERRDFVQNSNDSYWATNPADFLTGYSPLYGPTETQLSPRTHMGLKMLEHPTDAGLSNVKPAGDDGKFTGKEIINALYSNRAYYAEMLLPTLLDRCQAAGNEAIPTTGGNSRSIAAGCSALASWNGVYNTDSTGAQVFRVFIAAYNPSYPDQFTVAFDPTQPATTPNTPKPATADPANDPMLQALATGLDKLDQGGIAYDTPLGQVQYEQQSAGVPPGGTAAPSGDPIPWPGNQNFEGGFDIVSVATQSVDDGTRFPRVAPASTIADTGSLSATSGQGWLIGYGTSWHFGLNFTANGPEAYGLVSYSQSDDPSSPHFSDQDERFSNKNYRKLLYSDSDIKADPNLTTQTINGQVPANNS